MKLYNITNEIRYYCNFVFASLLILMFKQFSLIVPNKYCLLFFGTEIIAGVEDLIRFMETVDGMTNYTCRSLL